MFTTVATVLVTFVFAGILGNKIIYRLQQKNWLIQKRIQESVTQNDVLSNIFDEIATLAGRRHYRMRRLLNSVSAGDKSIIASRLNEYDDTLIAWNERLSVLFAKMTVYLDHTLTTHMENIVHHDFVRIGAKLERIAKAKIEGKRVETIDIRQISRSLDALNGKLILFNKRILGEIHQKKVASYQAKVLSPHTLEHFPTWELLKALFKHGEYRMDVL